MTAQMAYGTGRIQFIPVDRSGEQRNYSDRSIILLLEENFPNAVLCGRDVDNNNREIFNIPLRRIDQYNRGGSKDNPDEIRNNNGTYRLWLNEGSRAAFYQGLDTYFQQLALFDQPTTNSPAPSRSNDIPENRAPRNVTTDDYHPQPARKEPSSSIRTDPVAILPKDLISEVHLLGELIEEGKADVAGEKASQLALGKIRVQSKPRENAGKEEPFTIEVQLDGNEYGLDQHGAIFPISVFPTTTVRELRATFEISQGFAPTNQYFFVNGHLAHDNSTMKDLNVGPGSLFVLYFLKHSKNNRPWQCRGCRTNNPATNLRCIQCQALPPN